MTALQQQQLTPSPPTVSQRARHAFSIYCECVAAGQWARLSIEQRPEGEIFHVSSRPSAAAPAAARARPKEKKNRRRRPNKKRLAAKQLWRESRGSRPAAAVPGQQQLQQPCQPAVAASAASGSYAQVAASAGSPAKAAAAAHIGSLVSSPRLTRAAKRRKELSPGDRDVAAFVQLDGAHATPPSSPPASRVGSLPAPTQLISVVCGVGSPTAPTPPPLPPPPWHVGSPTAPTCPPSDGHVGSPTAPTPPLSHSDDVGSPSAPTSRPLPPLDGPPDEPSTAAVGSTPPAPLWLARLPPHLSICKLCRAGCHGPNYSACSSCNQKKNNS